MNVLDNPITQQAANLLSQVKPGSPLDDALEVIGIVDPGKLADIASADSIGDVAQAFYESLGFDPEFAAAFGAAGDLTEGDVGGVVEKSVEAAELAGGIEI